MVHKENSTPADRPKPESDAEARKLLDALDGELLQGLLDNPYESLILVDREGIVRFMSSANEGVYPFDVREAVGRPISEVSPESRLHQVLKTGKAEIGRSMVLRDKQHIVARFPIFKDGRIIGAAGKLMFLHPEKLKELYERIDSLKTRLKQYQRELRRAHGSRYTFDHILGEAPRILDAKAMARKAAEIDAPVLITGESGTGKELFAHAIHCAGKRRNQAFVRVNCAAIPNDLLESELFGYEAGAFTGADPKGKIGKFELAHEGTIFLDEIGDMPLQMQVKIMRVLQEKEIEPVGAKAPRRIDFRLISATNQDLETRIRKGEFRLDLYYRINLMVIQLPPLRAIKADISRLADYYLGCMDHPRSAFRITPAAKDALTNYEWPGNVRELKNVIERATIVCRNGRITPEDLWLAQTRSPTTAPLPCRNTADLDLKLALAETEKKLILEALRVAGGNKAKAAQLLGIHRTGLYQKMAKLKIE